MLCNVERKKRIRKLIKEQVAVAVKEVVATEAAVADTEVAVVEDTVVVVNQDMVAVEVVHQIGQTLDSKIYLQMQDHLTQTSHDQGSIQAVCPQVECHQVCVQVVHKVPAVHHKVCDQEVHLQEACAHQVVCHLAAEALLQVAIRVISLETLSASEIVYSFL